MKTLIFFILSLTLIIAKNLTHSCHEICISKHDKKDSCFGECNSICKKVYHDGLSSEIYNDTLVYECIGHCPTQCTGVCGDLSINDTKCNNEMCVGKCSSKCIPYCENTCFGKCFGTCSLKMEGDFCTEFCTGGCDGVCTNIIRVRDTNVIILAVLLGVAILYCLASINV